MGEALSVLELQSLARGLRCLDALIKKAPVEVLEANLIEPGRFLILLNGGVAEIDEAHQEALAIGAEDVVDHLQLFDAHPLLVDGLRGHTKTRSADDMDCLGVVEGRHVASTLRACDRSLKDADVTLAGIRVTGGLGGKAYYVLFGAQHDVEVALDVAAIQLAEHCVRTECIPRPHDEMVPWLLRPTPFQVG